jgi:sulfite reductase alpha subunit-like flavoprotein
MNDEVEFTITRGTLKIPDDSTPIIYIGPGTGIAPMRSIIASRIAKGVRGDLIFFGSRNKNADFFYGKEFSEYDREGKCRLITAFSRDQENKVYVQHRIKEEAKEVWRILCEENGVVLLSGYCRS